jgi:hypothetical protein
LGVVDRVSSSEVSSSDCWKMLMSLADDDFEPVQLLVSHCCWVLSVGECFCFARIVVWFWYLSFLSALVSREDELKELIFVAGFS